MSPQRAEEVKIGTLTTSSPLSARIPDGIMIGSVDHHIPIILYNQMRTIVTIRKGSPNGFMCGSVDHQVAVRLHDTLAYGPTIRVGGPNGNGFLVVRVDLVEN